VDLCILHSVSSPKRICAETHRQTDLALGERKTPDAARVRGLSLKTSSTLLRRRLCMASVQTRSEIHPLCYEHHNEMTPVQLRLKTRINGPKSLAYACREPSCLIHYAKPRGYFMQPDGNQLDEEITPCVPCPYDGTPMYLARVRREERSFRLWRCPQCNVSRTNLEFLRASA
jgi:hypothetical protein